MSSQNLQDGFLNNARKERMPVTIYLTSGVKLSGRVKGFDKYCVVFETNHQEQLIFKHAISTVVTAKQQQHGSTPYRAAESHRAPESRQPSSEPLEPGPALGVRETLAKPG
jgi:host factor-I protein